MLEDWEETLTAIALLWHQPREYVLEQEIIRIWEVVRIQHKKHSDPKEDNSTSEEILEDIDEAQKATFQAQAKARARRKALKEKEKENGNQD